MVVASFGLLLACSGSNGPEPDRHVAARISLDTPTVWAGRTAEVSVFLTPNLEVTDAIDSINSFTIAFEYDHTALQFNGASLGSEVTDWSGISIHGGGLNNLDRSLTTIRLGARRKSGSQPMPWGEIATISFFAIPFTGAPATSTEIGFVFNECGDNTLGDAADDSLLHFTKHVTFGDSTLDPADSLNCPRYLNVVADLELSPGLVLIEPDSVVRTRGDQDQDGDVDITDVVHLVNAALRGDSVFSDDPTEREQKLRDLDVNWDGQPKQVSDLEMLIRLVFKNLDAETPLWPALTPALFELQSESLSTIAILQSEIPITALYLDISYESGSRPSFDFVSPGAVPYEQIISDTNAAMIFEDLDHGAIANSFRPFEIRIRKEPGQSICLRTIQASTRPGIAVPVHVKSSDRCD